MRVFVTGASGWIGSAVVPELLAAGHEVVGLARSESSAAALVAAGAEVRRGDLEDLEVLRVAAEDADGVIHLAFIHDFSAFATAAEIDRVAIDTMGEVLEGSDRPLVIVSGTLGLAPGRVATEHDLPDLTTALSPRARTERAALDLAGRGVRSASVRLSPSVHGVGDHGFVARLVEIAREQGVSGHIGDGANRWTGVHRLDAARLFRLAVEQAPPGTVLHGVADTGVPIRSLAEVIGRHLDLPVVAVDPEDAPAHFGWLAPMLSLDAPATSEITQELLSWHPTEPGLLEDLDLGHYFATPG